MPRWSHVKDNNQFPGRETKTRGQGSVAWQMQLAFCRSEGMHVIKKYWRSKRIEPRWSGKWGIIVWRNVHRLGRISVDHPQMLDLRTEAAEANTSTYCSRECGVIVVEKRCHIKNKALSAYVERSESR